MTTDTSLSLTETLEASSTEMESIEGIPDYLQPVHMTIDEVNHFLLAEFEGSFNGTEVVACFDAFLSCHPHVVGMNCIADLRSSKLDNLSAQHLVQLVDVVEFWLKVKRAQKIAVAVVAASIGKQQKLKFYQRIANQNLQQIRFFSDIAAAKAWIAQLPR